MKPIAPSRTIRDTWSALLTSRKAWVGFFAMFVVACCTLLRALDKLPVDALVPTIAGIVTVGVGVIGAIAAEDAARWKANAATAEVDLHVGASKAPPTETQLATIVVPEQSPIDLSKVRADTEVTFDAPTPLPHPSKPEP